MEFDPKKHKTMCLYPFMHMSTIPAGFYRPCCFFTDFIKKDGEDRFATITSESLNEVWNSQQMKEVRLKMLAGEEVPGCVQCYQEEKNGSETSMRFRSFHQYQQHPTVERALQQACDHQGEVEEQMLFLEIKPGNLCNLKCRMCNQFDSSSYAAEIKEIVEKEGLDPNSPRLYEEGHLDTNFSQENMPDWDKEPKFWEEVKTLMPKVETLSFAGGEPTLIEEVHNLLDYCVDQGHSRHQHVFFSSNLTHMKPTMLKNLHHFRTFEYIASLDGFGSMQEYIRHPSKWNKVAENYLTLFKLQQQVPGLRLSCNITIQLYNILQFTDLLRWFDEIEMSTKAYRYWPYNLNLLFAPDFLRIDNLPPNLRTEAKNRIFDYLLRKPAIIQKFPHMAHRLKFLIQSLEKDFNPQMRKNLTTFMQYTETLDKNRNVHLEALDPLLYNGIKIYLESPE